MATYNGAQFVIRQLDSVLKQLNEDDQVIIVDDRSSDRTLELIKDKYGHRVEVHVNEQNLGAIKSFEKAISLAKGEIVFLCDQDDIWEENKVEVVLNAFRNQNADLIVHDAYVVDGRLEVLDPSWNHYNANNTNQKLWGNLTKNAFTGAMMAFRKELIPSILPFPKSIEMHDQWIALVCMLENRNIIHINQPLMKYVRHGGNVTGIKKRKLTEQLKGRIGTFIAILNYKKD
ncbi:glycosyltransferase family 2 protein [Niallia sp. Krafla_26]|uniref:glycosyltransferase family 2 protein n=1 Tax=Niallia sp. Krafla_26 TaxID=3064703 RepID=UPI003D187323